MKASASPTMLEFKFFTTGAWLVLFMLGASGCAFLSKGEARSPRYFSPTIESATVEPAREQAALARPELRVGRVEPAAYLEERIAYRVSDNELAYYEDRRWTEPPEQFVRRALESELFETHAFRRVVSGEAPTLDVEVLSFEELRQGGAPRARLSLLITLRDERHALLERTVTAVTELEQGAHADEGRALAAAMADALSRVTKEVAERVSSELTRRQGSTMQARPTVCLTVAETDVDRSDERDVTHLSRKCCLPCSDRAGSRCVIARAEGR
jgi:cholesterol transport system auxiliary component